MKRIWSHSHLSLFIIKLTHSSNHQKPPSTSRICLEKHRKTVRRAQTTLPQKRSTQLFVWLNDWNSTTWQLWGSQGHRRCYFVQYDVIVEFRVILINATRKCYINGSRQYHCRRGAAGFFFFNPLNIVSSCSLPIRPLGSVGQFNI